MAQYSLELCFRVAFLAVLLPLASGACVDLDLGMGRGTIPNSNITASSVRSANTPAKNGRLNYTSGPSWCAGISDTNPYLQIDLQTLHIICAVSTQGNSKADQWVKNYTLKFSINGTTWTNYKEGGQVKFLRGNDDRNSEVKHVVYGVLARYLRFLPQTHQGEVCMRTEVFGVKQKQTCKMEAIGLAYGGKIPDSSFTASTHVAHNRYIPSKGRLNGGDRGWGPKDRNVAGDYLQIDLLYEYIICAVATQGANGINEWTKNYKIQLSLNGSSFVTYQEDNVDRVFTGNSDQNTVKTNSLQEFASAKFIRFWPMMFNSWKVLRVEVYGVLLTKVPSKPPTDFKLTATSPTSIMASWQSPPVFARHGRTITGFILFYKKKSSGVPVISLNVTDGSTLSRNVTGLDEYTEYEFQVLAYTSDGIGPKSHVKVERTNEAAPSQAPSSFSVSAVTSTIITASWQLPPVGSRNGIIKGFRLFYKKRGSKGPTTILPIKNGTALSTDVSGLDVYTEYEFEVLTFTSAGDGPKSSPVVVVRTRKDGCVEFNLGMEDGRIPNSGISASSSSTPAKNGRLNYTPGSSWCAGTSDSNPYLQIDLQTLHIICAVSTQGNSKADQWVKNYTLQLSTDETTWTDYREGGKVKVLIGNDDRSSIVKHVVYGLLTRYLRFLPQTHQAGVCMRTEVFGVKQKPICEEEAIGVAFGGKIPDDSFSASTYYSAAYIPSYGRLKGGKRGWGPKDKNKNGDYLQIDLQYEYIVCAVATQGARDTAEWTKSYKIQLSLTGTTFLSYKKDTNNKDFPGNTDRNSIIKNSLQDFSSAKYIRFQPVSYNAWKVLRVEVYGILLSKVPSKPPTALKLTAKSSASINASWQLPPVIARHGTIAGFRLFYSKKGSREQAVKNGTTLSMLVSGLDKFTEYEFQVLAYTPGGDGPKSSVKVERTMEDVPSRPPSNFTVIGTSSTSVTASWQLPPADSRNGIIKGFKLFYKRKELSGAGTLFQINKESTLSKNVTGLDKYTEYEFRVLTFTSVGDGVNSSVVVKRTKEDVPTQPPSGLTVTATTSTSITASWQLPPEDSRNGIIRGFKLFYKEKGSSGPQRMQRIDNEATRTKEVIGLEKFTEYEFQILAFTSVGDGSKSTAVFIKTKEAAPSRSPSQFTVTVESSTSISVSWKSPPEKYRHGIIRGYKLFYKKKDSGFATSFTIDNGKTSKIVTNLDEYTEYEFQVLAFTSAGDGLNSSVKVERTMEDAPSAPMSLSFVDVPPSNLQGPRMTLSWHKPAKPNGVVRSYTLFYSHSGGTPREISELHKGALNHTVDVLGGATYQFHLRAVTIKPGANATKTVTTKEYAPSVGPKLASPSQVNKTTFNISWEPLPRGKSYGNVIRYEVKAIFLKKGNLRKRSVIDSPSVNTSDTFVVLYDLELCSTYNASVRAYTGAGPGPYGVPLELETSRPEAPGEFRATAYGANQVSLAWKQYDEKEKIEYTVKYTGTKDYNKTFKAGEKSIERIETTTKTVTELIPGTTYVFKVHGSSSCGESIFKNISVTTHMKAPDAPFPHNVSDVEVSGTAVDIFLWPVEQKYGPISAYQVIVLKVADGVEELPDKYDSKLKAANDAKTEDVNFYIAAEIENIPLLDKPQKFTVGDGEITEEYVNKKLEKGENYIVYERALTKTETVCKLIM
ncbi:uncharacterized protein LOC111343720 [Stylophora pistillata]|uniref:uncharacterized protein LOC111343720 n=1 Tax=Stylophora pistillata TaxID=50429 RepID=UPI000C055479|nr:uncharacterized protein LOC111343720 [Stylophora pistillata]